MLTSRFISSVLLCSVLLLEVRSRQIVSISEYDSVAHAKTLNKIHESDIDDELLEEKPSQDRGKRTISTLLSGIGDLFGFDVAKRPSFTSVAVPAVVVPAGAVLGRAVPVVPVAPPVVVRAGPPPPPPAKGGPPPPPPAPAPAVVVPAFNDNTQKSFTIALNWNKLRAFGPPPAPAAPARAPAAAAPAAAPAGRAPAPAPAGGPPRPPPAAKPPPGRPPPPRAPKTPANKAKGKPQLYQEETEDPNEQTVVFEQDYVYADTNDQPQRLEDDIPDYADTKQDVSGQVLTQSKQNFKENLNEFWKNAPVNPEMHGYKYISPTPLTIKIFSDHPNQNDFRDSSHKRRHKISNDARNAKVAVQHPELVDHEPKDNLVNRQLPPGAFLNQELEAKVKAIVGNDNHEALELLPIIREELQKSQSEAKVTNQDILNYYARKFNHDAARKQMEIDNGRLPKLRLKPTNQKILDHYAQKIRNEALKKLLTTNRPSSNKQNHATKLKNEEKESEDEEEDSKDNNESPERDVNKDAEEFEVPKQKSKKKGEDFFEKVKSLIEAKENEDDEPEEETDSKEDTDDESKTDDVKGKPESAQNENNEESSKEEVDNENIKPKLNLRYEDGLLKVVQDRIHSNFGQSSNKFGDEKEKVEIINEDNVDDPLGEINEQIQNAKSNLEEGQQKVNEEIRPNEDRPIEKEITKHIDDKLGPKIKDDAFKPEDFDLEYFKKPWKSSDKPFYEGHESSKSNSERPSEKHHALEKHGEDTKQNLQSDLKHENKDKYLKKPWKSDKTFYDGFESSKSKLKNSLKEHDSSKEQDSSEKHEEDTKENLQTEEKVDDKDEYFKKPWKLSEKPFYDGFESLKTNSESSSEKHDSAEKDESSEKQEEDTKENLQTKLKVDDKDDYFKKTWKLSEKPFYDGLESLKTNSGSSSETHDPAEKDDSSEKQTEDTKDNLQPELKKERKDEYFKDPWKLSEQAFDKLFYDGFESSKSTPEFSSEKHDSVDKDESSEKDEESTKENEHIELKQENKDKLEQNPPKEEDENDDEEETVKEYDYADDDIKSEVFPELFTNYKKTILEDKDDVDEEDKNEDESKESTGTNVEESKKSEENQSSEVENNDEKEEDEEAEDKEENKKETQNEEVAENEDVGDDQENNRPETEELKEIHDEDEDEDEASDTNESVKEERKESNDSSEETTESASNKSSESEKTIEKPNTQKDDADYYYYFDPDDNQFHKKKNEKSKDEKGDVLTNENEQIVSDYILDDFEVSKVHYLNIPTSFKKAETVGKTSEKSEKFLPKNKLVDFGDLESFIEDHYKANVNGGNSKDEEESEGDETKSSSKKENADTDEELKYPHEQESREHLKFRQRLNGEVTTNKIEETQLQENSHRNEVVQPLYSGIIHLGPLQELYKSDKPLTVPFDHEYSGSEPKVKVAAQEKRRTKRYLDDMDMEWYVSDSYEPDKYEPLSSDGDMVTIPESKPMDVPKFDKKANADVSDLSPKAVVHESEYGRRKAFIKVNKKKSDSYN